jgi:TPR repeat protein
MTTLSRPTYGTARIVGIALISIVLSACVSQQGKYERPTTGRSVEQSKPSIPSANKNSDTDKLRRSVNSGRVHNARIEAGQGIATYNSGKHRKAFELLKPLAEAGNPVAQFYLYKMKSSGEGTRKDMEEAFTWLLKSAESDYRWGIGALPEHYLK